jgi:hypothetical protein
VCRSTADNVERKTLVVVAAQRQKSGMWWREGYELYTMYVDMAEE